MRCNAHTKDILELFSFFSAAVISVLMATKAVNFIEETAHDQIKKQLLTGGVDWVDVEQIDKKSRSKTR